MTSQPDTPLSLHRIATLAWVLAEVHIGDNDDLGVVARELWDLLDTHYPQYRGTWTPVAEETPDDRSA